MARSRSIGNVYAELSVKDKMTAGLNRAEKSLKAFGSKVTKSGVGMAAALPAAAFAGVVASMKSAIDAGGKLSDMMARTGADGEKLFVMQRAFENAGIAGDKVPGVLNKMQKALAGVNEEGDRVQTRVFSDLGLSINSLRAMDPAMAFRKISESIAAIPDPAKRAALAMEIFGRSGGELLVVMNDGAAFEMAAKQVGGLGKTLSENAAKFDNISDSLGLLGTKAQQIGAEVAAELLPALTEMADALNELDLSSATRDAIDFAQALGKVASGAIDVAKNLPGVKPLGGLFGTAANIWGKGIKAVASRDPMEGLALPTAGAWVGGDPMANYNEGVMIRELQNFTDKIPELLKLRPELVAGMRLEESGIPGIASMIDALTASAAPFSEEQPKAAEIADIAKQTYDVNELQSRGLGFGGESVASQANKQIDILTQIRDVLKKASTDGQLVWS
jgi:hypothetical protein